LRLAGIADFRLPIDGGGCCNTGFSITNRQSSIDNQQSAIGKMPIALTLTEQMALYFSKGLFKPLQGTPMYESLESAMQKIGSQLPAQSGVARTTGFVVRVFSAP
jgi:hypothetical protein